MYRTYRHVASIKPEKAADQVDPRRTRGYKPKVDSILRKLIPGALELSCRSDEGLISISKPVAPANRAVPF